MRLLFLIAVGVVACGGSEEGGVGGIAIHARADEAPTWAVPYGAEFWRPAHGVDVQDAIGRVSHAFRGTETHGAGYSARVDGSGLRFEAGGAGLRLRTTRVNGREPGDVPWSIVGDTAQGLLAPGVIEHYQARDEGVEVSWVIARRGAVDIEATFDGLALDHDLHFVDGSGKRVAKLGAAALVDHAGHRWPVAPEVDGSVVRYRIGADIAASAEFPVALDPVIGPELTPDQPVIGSAPDIQRFPSVASNGTITLAVWEDHESYVLRGARISQAGVVLDPSGILLSDVHEPERPRVASNGTEFMVTWLGDDDVYAERVSAAGNVLDGGGVLVAHGGDGADPAVASDGADYLVAWRADRRFAASRITSEGVVLDPGGVLLSARSTGSGDVAVASNGTGYLALWSEDRQSGTGSDLYGTRVTAAGTVLDPQGLAISTAANDQSSVALTANGSPYVAAWQDMDGIHAARITATGTLLDPNGIALGAGANAALASDGTGVLVTWQLATSATDHSILARRLSAAGAVLDPAPLTVAESATELDRPAVAFDGAQYLVAWAIYGEPWDIQASRVASDGTIVDPTPLVLSTGPVEQYTPVVAASASEILVAWVDHRALTYDVYAARLSPTGVPLDPQGVVVRAGGMADFPAIASNGGNFLVTWSESTSPGAVYAAPVTSGVAGAPVQLVTGTTGSAVASDGTGYLVVWAGAPSGTIQGVRLTASGTVEGAPVMIASAAPMTSTPAVAWGGGQYLVAWSDGGSIGYTVRATRASAAGDVIGTPFTVASAVGNELSLALVASGSGYLVCWSSGFLPDLYAARIGLDGAVLDSSALAISAASGTYNNLRCSVASNGTDYLVAWERLLDGTGRDVAGARVTSTGTVVDRGGFGIAGGLGPQSAPSVAYSPASTAYLVAYTDRHHVHDRFVALTGCGDGHLDLAETCDDGGLVDGDGCSASCAVEPGYACTGAPSICTDIDECASDNGGCAQTCTNTVGGFVCSCGAGFVLDANAHTCDTTNINECATDNGGCAQACTNTPGSFVCSCGPGYSLASDGLGCDDVDECATDNGGCPYTCMNTVGSFECLCAPGFAYSSDGYTCEDVDECATNNGDCTQVCTNTPGSHGCGCQDGYMLDSDGTTCLDINECSAGTDDCDPFAFCINTIGSHECTCDEGYTGDGFTCEPVHPPDAGCGCRTTDARGSWLLVVACLGVLRRRRR